MITLVPLRHSLKTRVTLLTLGIFVFGTVARLGGDEFVVLLGVTQPGDPVTSVEHHCSASIGVVLFVNHLSSQTDLMKWADAAMYQAKDAGRNTIRFYEKKTPPTLVYTA